MTEPTPHDDALAQRIRSGDREALGVLYDRYASLALAAALRVVADREVAEDLVHDAFVAVWRKIDKFDPGRGSLRSWLLTVVRNRAIDRVVAQVHARLPGWDVVGATDTWEGGFAVVASCGRQEMGFQVVPGHGLPPDDAWLQPNDWTTRISLEQISDYPTFLIWRAQPQTDRTLSCDQHIAQAAAVQTRTQANARNISLLDGSYADLEASRHRRVD